MSKLSSRRSLHRQKGQALVFSTITMVVVLLSLFMMVSSGLLTTEKMRLQNTTDAAAYSGALLVSRDYNFSAYTNRAMVANQVAVAQMVGLTAWARHNDDAFNGVVPGPGRWIAAATAIVGVPSPDGAKYVLNDWPGWGRTAASQKRSTVQFTDKGIRLLNGLLETLSSSQNMLHLSTAVVMTPTIKKVIQANDSDANLSTSAANLKFSAQTVDSVKRFSKTYERSSAHRFADITHQSLDSFSGSSWTNLQRGPLPIPNKSPVYNDGFRDIPFMSGLRRVWTEHSGGTELSADFKSWTALDASRMYGYSQWWYIKCVWIVICYPTYTRFPFTSPLGLGSAVAGSGNVSFSNFWGDNYQREFFSYGSVLVANLDTVAFKLPFEGNQKIGNFGGLRPYQELQVLGTDSSSRKKITETALSTVLIEVEKPAPKLLTMRNMQGGPVGSVNVGTASLPIKLEDRLAGNTMRAVASAEAYFARPEGRSDGKTEWPSLFNPYWQVRLKGVSPLNIGFSNSSQ